MGIIRCSIIVSILIIILVLLSKTSARNYFSKHKQSKQINERIDCYPESISPFSKFSKQSCLNRNCLYDEDASSDQIQCYLSPNYGYILQESPLKVKNGLRLKLKRNSVINSMFSQAIENVLLDVQYYTNDIIRFKLYDADKKRYEVPIPLKSPSEQITSPQYQFDYSTNNSQDKIFSFLIKRQDNNAILFDTSLGGLVLNNQFLQIVTRLQSSYIYGFGENNHDTLKHNVQERKSWGIFARDQGLLIKKI